MEKIKIAITGRVASVVALPEVVADNAEYEVDFALDPREGWDVSLPITALFVRRDGSYTPRIMDAGATSCTMPPQTETNIVFVGLTQDDLRTTTPATIKVRRSIRTLANDPLPAPTEDVYAQILAAYAGIKILSSKGAPTSATQGKVNQLYRDELTDKLYICTGVEGGYTWASVVSDTEDAVTYTAQTLTNAQKTQARANIGAGTSNFSGSYNDLTNKPNIPAASVIDTTLSKSGQAADAKAAGDAIGRKIDAPQTAQVGEVLTVEEVDAEGKPKKWKTAPGTDITTELSEESTDEQVPSAKATYNAVHDAKWTTDFYINITKTTINGDSTYIADKTFAEIKEAYYSNMTVYAILFYGYNGYGYMIPASYYFDGSVNSTDNSCIYFNRVVDLKEIFNISIDINDNVIVESSETGISSHSWNDVPKVLQQSPNAISVSGAGAPDGGGLLFYNQGKRDKVISYNMISNSGRYYIVSYDRQYNTVGTYLAGTFAPAVTADDNGKILRVENGLWKPRENTSLPTPTTAQVGQIVKVKAVDADGKITETETVDMPISKSLKWITVHSSTLAEETTEIVVSTDGDGNAIADYNPIGLTLILSTPADATQTDNNGAPWVYPSATKEYNDIRAIGNISGWKTIARDNVFAFYGGGSAMICTGNINAQLATYRINGYALDGVRARLNGNTNHFPAGTHVEVSILCEVPDANVMPA